MCFFISIIYLNKSMKNIRIHTHKHTYASCVCVCVCVCVWERERERERTQLNEISHKNGFPLPILQMDCTHSKWALCSELNTNFYHLHNSLTGLLSACCILSENIFNLVVILSNESICISSFCYSVCYISSFIRILCVFVFLPSYVLGSLKLDLKFLKFKTLLTTLHKI
jgi:hypothetical protein